MYSDSIKEKQQELLDVLFKKANGSPFLFSASETRPVGSYSANQHSEKIKPEKTTSEPATVPEQTVLPASEQPINPPTPPAGTPNSTPVNPAPNNPTPAPAPTEQPPKKDERNGNPEIDPVALVKVLFDKAMRHKATSLGGLGGAGLGLMLGKSIPGRLLWGLLGGLGGAGLGYAAEKYIK